MTRAWAVLCAFALAGCLPFFNTDSLPQNATGTEFDAGGIQPAGTNLRIDFGRAQDGVVDTASQLFGAVPDRITEQSECGAGVVTAASWPGVTLNFLDGDFRGWVLAAPGLSAEGLTVGTPRAAINGVTFRETTLGTEFGRNGVFGLILPGEDDVSLLWSGVSCFFR
ncbi:MAG: hypothetical protein AAGF88_02200 [Pseudomonadota bacterium]